MTPHLSIEYEIRVAPPGMVVYDSNEFIWEKRTVCLVGPANPFEAFAMAAGLRAESQNIRDVHVVETSQVTRTIG